MRDSCAWIIAGPKTYRLASKQILPKRQEHNGKIKRIGFGGNLQNLEKSAREVYIADEGKMFSQTDQAGAEALIVAYLCEAGAFRQLFIHGVKPHVYVAMHVFKDIWQKKMAGREGFDINDIIRTPIQALKSNPFWKELDSLIKDSDNWSLDQRYYYLAKQTCHCVDGNTEVLTFKGWQKISDIASTGVLETEIAVFDSDRTIKFEIPSVWNSMHLTQSMIRFIGEEIDQLVTENHTVIYESNRKLHNKLAASARKLLRLNIPTSGNYIGGDIHNPDWYVKLLVAIQADGYWYSESNVRFRLLKQRKIERLLSIAKEGNIEFEIIQTDVIEITIKNIKHILEFFGKDKLWNSKLLTWSESNLRLFVDELKYWDGTFAESFHHKREEYSSKFNVNVLWVKTICHLIGKQGTIGFDDNVFYAGINSRKKSIAHTKQLIPSWTGTVYCPTVSTGMFLIRRNGKISITGNSANYGIEAPTFRMNILEKSGGKINISKDDGERFLLTYHSLFPEIQDWHRRLKRQAEQTKMLYNLFGHPYTITSYQILDSHWKELFSWIPQSTVGMITNIAFYRLQQFVEDNRLAWDNLINGHDSILSQAPIAEIIDLGRKQKEFIEQEFTSPVDGAVFRMKSETQAGFNWSNFKQDKNPLGLKEIKLS